MKSYAYNQCRSIVDECLQSWTKWKQCHATVENKRFVQYHIGITGCEIPDSTRFFQVLSAFLAGNSSLHKWPPCEGYTATVPTKILSALVNDRIHRPDLRLRCQWLNYLSIENVLHRLALKPGWKKQGREEKLANTKGLLLKRVRTGLRVTWREANSTLMLTFCDFPKLKGYRDRGWGGGG